MKKILVFIDWFSPGFRAGGPIKSIVNFVQLLSNDYQIYVYTSDRDLGQTEGYPGIHFNQWVPFTNNVLVHYTTQEMQNRKALQSIIADVHPDFIYINSMFSKHFSIAPLSLKKNYAYCKYILAPRGMLRKSALSFKPHKKKLFLRYAKLKGFYNNITFHATDATEVKDIREKISTYASIHEISNCPAKPVLAIPYPVKEKGALKIIFIGRVHPIKNLYFLLQVVGKGTGKIDLTIVGVLEDLAYWNKCKALITQMPETIKCVFLNELAPDLLEATIASHHVLGLPTHGENFGHAIYETLALGRPVLISDQTPWRHLYEKKAGWDLQLNDSKGFEDAIEKLAATNQAEFESYCANAHQVALDFYAHSDSKQNYKKLFS